MSLSQSVQSMIKEAGSEAKLAAMIVVENQEYFPPSEVSEARELIGEKKLKKILHFKSKTFKPDKKHYLVTGKKEHKFETWEIEYLEKSHKVKTYYEMAEFLGKKYRTVRGKCEKLCLTKNQKRLSLEDLTAIRKLLRQGVFQYKIAEMYGRSRSTINEISTKKHYVKI